MGNLSTGIKKFLQNKNTVTVLGVVVAIIILYVAYNMRVQSAINPINVPYAKEQISPGTQTFCPNNSVAGFTVALKPSEEISAPKALSISSVWFLESDGSVTDVIPFAYKPASNTQDLICAEETGEL